MKLLFPLLTILFFISTGCTDVAFDSEKWKSWNIKRSDSHMRWDMSDDLVDNYSLVGKSKDDILNLLGEPDLGISKSGKLFRYDLGPCRRGIDFAVLRISFEKSKVSNVKKYCH